MTDKKRISFIINPKSGWLGKSHIPPIIQFFFPKSRYDVKISYTKKAGDATVFASDFVNQGVDAVVAVGGDGTVNEVARALVGTDVVLGILPSGSGNGLARHLGIPMPAWHALDHLRRFNQKEIDVCSMNGKTFFCVAGIGYDAQITHSVSTSSHRGPLMYVEEIVLSFFDYKPEKYRITMDGKTIEREAFLITFANASQWGNNAIVAPNADISDGLMDVVIVTDFKMYKAPKFCLTLFTKRVDKNRYVEIFKCKRVSVERIQGGPIHFDGEPAVMGTNIDVSIRHNALKVYV